MRAFLVLPALAGVLILCASCTTSAHLVEHPTSQGHDVQAVPDPSLAGPFAVKRLFYGSGTDRHRPEYRDSVAFRTPAVDVSPFVSLSKKQARKRARYWGFDLSEAPLNGRVWYPSGEGPFPLVLIVHGNAHMKKHPSDAGYAYLGELLAGRGYVVASIDQNYLNQLAGEVDARGWLILEHLRLWRTWNETPGHPFYRRVDLERIALVGHSRGGEAIVAATVFNNLTSYPEQPDIAFDYGFGIRALVGLSPSDGLYFPGGRPLELHDVDYLLLQGGHDTDHHIYQGIRQYHRTHFSGNTFHFKAAVYAYRANHSRFSTAWGPKDLWGPITRILNTEPLLSLRDQQKVAQVYLSAFLETSLRGDRRYLSLFRDPRTGSPWLPPSIYVTQYWDSNYLAVSTYEEDIEPATATLPGATHVMQHAPAWRETVLRFRNRARVSQHNRALLIQWDATEPDVSPRYTIELPDDAEVLLRLHDGAALVFSLADAREYVRGVSHTYDPDRELLDFSVELTTVDRTTVSLPVSRVTTVWPPLPVRLTRRGWGWLERKKLARSSELVLQHVEIPLSAFREQHPDVDLSRIKTISFRFDRSASGAVVIDDVGFRLE